MRSAARLVLLLVALMAATQGEMGIKTYLGQAISERLSHYMYHSCFIECTRMFFGACMNLDALQWNVTREFQADFRTISRFSVQSWKQASSTTTSGLARSPTSLLCRVSGRTVAGMQSIFAPFDCTVSEASSPFVLCMQPPASRPERPL
jgi:hypothetical protein